MKRLIILFLGLIFMTKDSYAFGWRKAPEAPRPYVAPHKAIEEFTGYIPSGPAPVERTTIQKPTSWMPSFIKRAPTGAPQEGSLEWYAKPRQDYEAYVRDQTQDAKNRLINWHSVSSQALENEQTKQLLENPDAKSAVQINKHYDSEKAKIHNELVTRLKTLDEAEKTRIQEEKQLQTLAQKEKEEQERRIKYTAKTKPLQEIKVRTEAGLAEWQVEQVAEAMRRKQAVESVQLAKEQERLAAQQQRERLAAQQAQQAAVMQRQQATEQAQQQLFEEMPDLY